MAKKEEKPIEKIEREYIIPLREKCRVVPRYKKVNKAIKTIKEFLARHMKVRDRDLRKIKLDKYLNEMIWLRGIKKPPIKVKVKATKEGDIVKAELIDFPDNLKFKKLREEKKEKEGEEISKRKKTETKAEEKTKVEKTGEEKKEDKEKKTEEKEKKASVVEAGAKLEKAEAKKTKHSTKAIGKISRQKHQIRKALVK